MMVWGFVGSRFGDDSDEEESFVEKIGACRICGKTIYGLDRYKENEDGTVEHRWHQQS